MQLSFWKAIGYLIGSFKKKYITDLFQNWKFLIISRFNLILLYFIQLVVCVLPSKLSQPRKESVEF